MQAKKIREYVIQIFFLSVELNSGKIMKLIYSLLFGFAVFAITYSYNVRLVDWLRFQSIGARDEIVEKLGRMFIDIPPNKVLVYMILCAVIPFFLTFLLFLPRVGPGLILGCVAAFGGWMLPKPFVNVMLEKRTEKFGLQMVDGLNLMGNAMKSGLSVAQAMGIVVEQSPQPLSQEFGLVLSENKLGVSLEDALINLSKRIKSEDVEMFVTSVVILKETGGNLAETFDTIVHVIRERIKVQAKIKSMTAQGFYQGMVLLCVPPALGLYFSVSEPGFMDPMFNSPVGWVALSVVLGLEVAAYFTIKKVMQIDV